MSEVTNGSTNSDDREPTKEELEAEFNPNDKGEATDWHHWLYFDLCLYICLFGFSLYMGIIIGKTFRRNFEIYSCF
jgi:hypothetical protein